MSTSRCLSFPPCCVHLHTPPPPTNSAESVAGSLEDQLRSLTAEHRVLKLATSLQQQQMQQRMNQQMQVFLGQGGGGSDSLEGDAKQGEVSATVAATSSVDEAAAASGEPGVIWPATMTLAALDKGALHSEREKAMKEPIRIDFGMAAGRKPSRGLRAFIHGKTK